MSMKKKNNRVEEVSVRASVFYKNANMGMGVEKHRSTSSVNAAYMLREGSEAMHEAATRRRAGYWRGGEVARRR